MAERTMHECLEILRKRQIGLCSVIAEQIERHYNNLILENSGLRGSKAGLGLANKLLKHSGKKIQAKSTRRKKALKQLNRSVTEWQRLALARCHAKDIGVGVPENELIEVLQGRIKTQERILREISIVVFSDDRLTSSADKIAQIIGHLVALNRG